MSDTEQEEMEEVVVRKIKPEKTKDGTWRKKKNDVYK